MMNINYGGNLRTLSLQTSGVTQVQRSIFTTFFGNRENQKTSIKGYKSCYWHAIATSMLPRSIDFFLYYVAWRRS